MNNMSNLYRQVIMEHYKSPRNKGLTGIGKQNHLRNPSCGDDITIEVEIEIIKLNMYIMMELDVLFVVLAHQ